MCAHVNKMNKTFRNKVRQVLFSPFINNTEQEWYSDKYPFLYTVKFSLLQNTAYV